MITVDFARLEPAPGWRVLDVGCGSGRHTAAARRLPGARVVGLDPSVRELAAAAERLALHDRLEPGGDGRAFLLAGDALRLPFRAASFDLVLCCEVLEHVEDDRRAARELGRVLRPGGLLVVSVPHDVPERLCWALSRTYARAPGGHVRIYRKDRLLALFRGAGFTPIASHRAHGFHSPYWWLKCLCGLERTEAAPVRLYRRFLTWQITARPRALARLERRLDPLLGKSLVVYFRKASPAAAEAPVCTRTARLSTRECSRNRPEASARRRTS